MNTEDVKTGLANLEVLVAPTAEPYGRLLRRARRARHTRLAAWLAALAAVVVTAGLVPGLSAGTAAPTPSPTAEVDALGGNEITPWIQRLLDTPASGALASDPAFRETLPSALTPHDFGLSSALSQREILFAGDVGRYRAVLLVFHSDTRAFGVWLVADNGTAAAQFVQTARDQIRILVATPTADLPVKVLPGDLQPFSVTAVTEPEHDRYLAIGVAPAGCQVASRARADLDWVDSPAGNVVERTDPLAASALARVTCGGVVRFEGPLTNNARVEVRPSAATARQIDTAISGARGTAPDRGQVADVLRVLVEAGASMDSCRVLFAGQVPGSDTTAVAPGGPAQEPPILVMACATARGNTIFHVDAGDLGGFGGYSRTRLTDPAAVFAVSGVRLKVASADNPGDLTTLPDERVLVLAPAGATLVEVLRPGQAAESVPLVNGVGSTLVPTGQHVELRARNSVGALVASGTGPVGESIPEERVETTLVENWS